MLEVAQINYISHEVNQKGVNYASVGRRMGVGPRTVKKYANKKGFPTKRKQKRKSSVMDPVKPIIDKWINEDLKKKKKYQRIAKKYTNSYETFIVLKVRTEPSVMIMYLKKEGIKGINGDGGGSLAYPRISRFRPM